MQRCSAEDGVGYTRSAEFIKGPEHSKHLQRGTRHPRKDEAPQQFVVCINLGDVPPENVNAAITGRTVNITGERTEMIEERDGMIRKNYQGFSNTFNIPPEVDIETLNLTICEKHTLLVEADCFDNIDALEEYNVEAGPRQSRLKSLDKLSPQVASCLDLVSPMITSSEPSGDSLYETALQYHSSKESFIPSADRSRRSSAAARPLPGEKRSSVSDSVPCRRHMSQEIALIHEEGRRGSVPHSTESRRPSITRERPCDERRRSAIPQPIESRRTSISRDRIQSIQEGERASISRPVESRRTSKSLEHVQEENKRSTKSIDIDKPIHGEHRGSMFSQDQSRRSSMGSPKRTSVHEERKKGSINEHEPRKPAGREKPHKGKRCSKSHRDKSRSALGTERNSSVHSKRKDPKGLSARRDSRPLTPSTDKSSNSIETSVNSSGSTISNTSKTSWNSDEVGSAGSMQSRPSITDTSGVSPKSARDSISSQPNSTAPRHGTQGSSAVSSSSRVKHTQKSNGAKKTFDNFPFCCCPQSF